ncbi:SET domain-containing protein, partial [Gymnopus androsaceus JB14]
GGRGAVALKDFEEGENLFTIPRSLTLSVKTSSLPPKLGLNVWNERKLNKGWSGLILCMMWEAAQGSQSKWEHYLATLPTAFDTPMFWNDNDLKELEGTSVVEKLGKDDAERDYNEKVLPAIQSRPDLFPLEAISGHYSLQQYHLMGSRILSRSFDVERTGTDEESPHEPDTEADKSTGSAMDVDTPETPTVAEDTSEAQDDRSSEDGDGGEENPVDVSMVPIADLLNARFGAENAKLFYDETELKMIATKEIKAGEQIWNTYGDLPNVELLRRYGHVDLLPLPGGGKGNPADVVEIRADLVLSTFSETSGASSAVSNVERIDWWLEEGGDDVFVLDTDYECPEEMISLIRLLYLSPDEWEKARGKGKPPKPKLDLQVLDLLVIILQKRLAQYPLTIKDDEEILENQALLPLNKYQATVVRLGEKRILDATLEKLLTLRAAEIAKDNGSSKKRKSALASEGSSKSAKKSKR